MKNKPKIFIPFLDGILNYDCRKCGTFCCRQFGNLLMNLREKRKLVREYPALRYFFTQETKKTYELRRDSPCWFFENNGLCFIQKKYGSSYKPFICRLHPFYVARCEDEYVVTVGGLGGCPDLHVNARNKGIACKQILKNAWEAIYYNVVQVIDLPMKRLNLEKKILDGSKPFLNNLDYLDFAAYQISITIKNPDLAGIKSELLGYINLWKEFLRLDKLNLQNKRLTFELTAVTSMLRIENPRLRQMEVTRVPSALLALYFYLLLFAKTRTPRTYVQTYRQILDDIALSLLYLKNDDLKIKNVSLEGRIRYLYQLQMLHRNKK